jgi:UDP-N-acetylglucosamine 3-dehydrogenase
LIGRQHAAALSVARDAELALCVDTNPEAATHVPVGAAFSTDIASLEDADLDAVIVATPEAEHREPTEAALAVGASVLCEKPLASSLEDADAMIDAARGARAFLAVAHIVRFDPRYRSLRDRVVAGELGRLLSVSARRAMGASEGRIYAGRTSLPLCLGIHDLDAIRWLGGEVVRVHGEAGPRLLEPASADSFAATLKLESGAVATLDLGWGLSPQSGITWDTHLVAIGAEASGYVELRGGDAGDLVPESTYDADVAGIPMSIVRLQDEHFIRAVSDPERWPGADPPDARRALELALALDRSAATGVAIDV